MRRQAFDRLTLTASSAALQHRYWRRIFPHVRAEQQHWLQRASTIPNPALRQAALAALRLKRGNPQGAAIFATLAPVAQRPSLVRGLVVFQTMYDYLDTLSEAHGASSPANARQLHRALVDALTEQAPATDYYALHPASGDGRYLRDLVSACRTASLGLPSYALVADRSIHYAGLLVDYQGMIGASLAQAEAAEAWAHRYTDAYCDMAWWEIVAAAGSSLPVFALLATASDPATSLDDVVAIDRAYFPGIAVLHSMLDGLVDQAEDVLAGNHNLLTNYASQRVAADRLFELADRAIELARGLPRCESHVAIISAMASYYLAAPEASRPESRQARRAILNAVRGPVAPGMLLFRLRRLARGLRRARVHAP